MSITTVSKKRKHINDDRDDMESSKRVRSPDGSAVPAPDMAKWKAMLLQPMLTLYNNVQRELESTWASFARPGSFAEGRARRLGPGPEDSPPLPSRPLAGRLPNDPSEVTALPSPAPSRSTSPLVATHSSSASSHRRPGPASLFEPFSSHASSSKETIHTPPSPPPSSSSSHGRSKDGAQQLSTLNRHKLMSPPPRPRPWLSRSRSAVGGGGGSPEDEPDRVTRTTPSIGRGHDKKSKKERRKLLKESESRLGDARSRHIEKFLLQHHNDPAALASVDEKSLSELQSLLAKTQTDWSSDLRPPPPSSPLPKTLKNSLSGPACPSADYGLARSLHISQKSRNDSRRERIHLPEMDALKIRDEESDDRIKQRMAKLAPKLPDRLTDAQNAEVEALKAKGSSHISRCNREQVTASDLKRLAPREWVNDEIMNFYGTMIQDASDARVALAAEGKLDKDDALSLHYFSTFFFAKLENPGYEKAKLSRWTKKIDIFKKDLVLIPINQGNAHWTCAIINFKHKRIEAYDSMGEGSARSIFKKLKGYLQSESLDKKKKDFDFEGWEMYTDSKSTPQQMNGFDCGIFSCQVLESVSRGEGYGNWSFSQANMTYFRRRMMLEISRAKLLNNPSSAP